MPIPVLTVVQMREWEQATWATGVSEQDVIEKVGARLARRILALTRPDDTLLLLAGKGHNGDDVRAAVKDLNGRSTELLSIRDPAADLARLKERLASRPDLVVDGLFGIGVDRPLEGAWADLVNTLNASDLPVWSVDVPSGLDADGGKALGTAVRAARTLTVGAPKAGLLAPGAARFTGQVEVISDVGLIPCPHRGDLLWTLPRDFTGYPPRRPADAHKGSCGHLHLLAGGVGYHGAAVLAARGAQRARPGLITLQTQPAAFPIVAGQLQSVMVRPWDVEQLAEGTALLAGPGLATSEAKETLSGALRKMWVNLHQPFLVDASALDWLPMGGVITQSPRVITPHPGEAGRLMNANAEVVQADRVRAVRQISSRFGDCWVVLKGHQTLIGRSDGEIHVNPSGNAALAQGGSGDLLAGYLAGLLAQPQLAGDALTAMRYAVWQHGAAADLLSTLRPNWTMEDLADHLGLAHPEEFVL